MPDWARAYDLERPTARLRSTAQDFAVTEILSFEPDGTGEHEFLWLQKIDANTQWVARQLAQHASVPARDVSYAGLKDRHAVTRQWFSVRNPGKTPIDWSSMNVEGVTILDTTRNSRKLRRGAHAANHFQIVLRDLATSSELQATLAAVSGNGVPNYFGEQRFGHGGNNLQLALRLFAGRRMSRDKRSIALSAARAWLFNWMLQQRVADRSWNQLRPGETAALDGSNSIFRVDDPDPPLQERCTAMDIHPTAPLWGSGPDAQDCSDAVVASVIAQFPEFAAGLARAGKAARRALRLPVREFSWRFDDRSLQMEFSLSRGGFATAVLRELAVWDPEGPQPASSST